MDPIETIEQINDDFINRRGPFEGEVFPEERLLEEVPSITMEEKLSFISAFASFDYNRDANQLVDNLIQLYEEEAAVFSPNLLYDTSHDEMKSVFADIGFRYPSRDAKSWLNNSKIVREEYNSQWHELVMSVSMDAPSLVERLEEDDFHVLKGDKVAPMYARIINDEVAPMNNLWMLDIPVDTHISTLTQKLTDAEMSNDDVRTWWGVMGKQADIELHTIDGGLWMIGNNWDSWGEEYWESLQQ